MYNIKYHLQSHLDFIEDMNLAGLEIVHYNRNFHIPPESRHSFSQHRPSVIVPNIEMALNQTDVKCDWEQVGPSFVVYPN